MVVSHVCKGLFLSFALWAVAFVVGSGLLTSIGPKAAVDGEDKPDLVSASATGFALIIAGLFVLGALHAFHVIWICVFFSLLVGLALALTFRRFGIAGLFGLYIGCLRDAGVGSAAVLVMCVALAAPAALPFTSSDDTMYHFAEAVNWARSGSLVVDPYIRFPLAPLNIELLYAAAFAFHLEAFVQFITWLFYALTATGIVCLTKRLLRTVEIDLRFSNLTAIIAALLFISFPLALRYSVVGFIDIPSGFFVLALANSLIGLRKSYLRNAVACAFIGGSLAGDKLSLAPFAVFTVAALGYSGWRSRVNRWLTLFACVLAIVVASPWFVRSAIASGDPIDPVFNLAFHHSDPFWSQADLDEQKADLHQDVPLIAWPIWAFTHPNIVVGAVSLSFIFLYCPFILLGVAALKPGFRKRYEAFCLLTLVVVFAVIEELLVSNRVARYTLHFYGAFCIFLAVGSTIVFQIIATKSQRLRKVLSFAPSLTLVVLGLCPQGTDEYSNFRESYNQLYQGIAHRNAVLTNVAGYREAEEISRILNLAGDRGVVLAIGFENLAYYFRAHDVVSAGDYFGRARYSELEAAIDQDHLDQKLHEMDVVAVLLRRDDQILTTQERKSLVRALLSSGYTEISNVESDQRSFVRSSDLRLAESSGFSLPPEEQAATNSVDFIRDFDLGQISPNPGTNPAPGGTTALLLPALNGSAFDQALTLIGGFNIAFQGVHPTLDSRLSFGVAKLFDSGNAGQAWVDVTDHGRTKRIFAATLPNASADDGPLWHNASLSLPVTAANGPLTLTFGASSEWVGFVHPRLTDATIDEMPTKSTDFKAGVSFYADPISFAPGKSMGIVTLHWVSPFRSVSIHVNSKDGPAFVKQGGVGSADTGEWAADGTKFYLEHDLFPGDPDSAVVIATTRAHK